MDGRTVERVLRQALASHVLVEYGVDAEIRVVEHTRGYYTMNVDVPAAHGPSFEIEVTER